MKGIILSVMLFLCVTTMTLAEEKVFDFRQTNWGMNIEQVKVAENKEIAFETDNSLGHVLVYKADINNKKYACLYCFLEDKLYFAGYVLDEIYTNKNDYIRDYKDIKKLLTKKYGESDNKKLMALHRRGEIFWNDDLYKDDKSEWGLAISIGDLSYGMLWETPNTDIELIMDGNNYNITLRIRYFSKELREWAEKLQEEMIQSNL